MRYDLLDFRFPGPVQLHGALALDACRWCGHPSGALNLDALARHYWRLLTAPDARVQVDSPPNGGTVYRILTPRGGAVYATV